MQFERLVPTDIADNFGLGDEGIRNEITEVHISELCHCLHHELVKNIGQTELSGVNMLERPRWKWPAR